jgi:hypothetical protein
MGALIFSANRFTNRYPTSAKADLILGCAVIGLPSIPLIVSLVLVVSTAIDAFKQMGASTW